MDDPLLNRPEKGKIKVIDPHILKKEKRKDFQITQASRLRYRTRYKANKEPVPILPLETAPNSFIF